MTGFPRATKYTSEVTPNPGTTFPWDDHVHPLSEQDDRVVRQLVEMDRDLFQEAQERPRVAAHQVHQEKILFRSGAPRIGEPLFRTQLDIRFEHPSMNCGRGTGHLGTGMYFFGTLSASTGVFRRGGRDWPKDVASIREIIRDVHLVDLSAIPASQVYVPPNDESTNNLHGFGKAMMCWVDHYTSYLSARHARKQVELHIELAREGDKENEPVTVRIDGEKVRYEDAGEALFDLEEELSEARRTERAAEDTVRADVWKMQWYGPTYHFGSGGGLMSREAARQVELKPPEEVQSAIDAYLKELERPRIPGYHPMTYYMTAMGYQAVVHGSWEQLNSGDIGNIWYPLEAQ